jgi:hypothetical protein
MYRPMVGEQPVAFVQVGFVSDPGFVLGNGQ